MRITPLDIRKQEFRKTMRGLDGDEVYAFLTTVAEEYEAVLSDNKQLRERIVEIEERLKEYKSIETNLRNTLLTAERVTIEAKENAHKEANLIVREAEVEAEKAAETIRAHTQQLRREVLELKRQKDNYLTRFRTLIDSHHRVLDGFQEDFANADKEIEEIGQKVEEDLNKGAPTPRISREKITEEFTHGPKDKATWGDEQRREDSPRPSIPDPSAAPQPDVNSFDTEDESEGEPPVNEAQTSLLPEDEKYNTNHIDVDPIGLMNAPTGEAPDMPAGDAPADTGDKNSPMWSGDEVRRNVAKSIEEQLYPEAGSAGTDQATSVSASAADVMTETPNSADPDQPQPAVQEPQQGPAAAPDQWKQYDVREKKQNWKEYEIPESVKAEKPVEPTVEDSEVEEALSGLTEAVEQTPDQKAGDDAQEIVTLQDEVPKNDGKKAPESKPEAAAPKTAQQPVGGPPKKNETEWSMDELRKNLSNLANDD